MTAALTRFVRRWKYTITMGLLLAGSTGLLLVFQPRNWWVPSVMVAIMMWRAWPGRRR